MSNQTFARNAQVNARHKDTQKTEIKFVPAFVNMQTLIKKEFWPTNADTIKKTQMC